MTDIASSLPRLSAATLGHVRPGVTLPGYDRARLGTGIVHLGLGAFVRAHVAAYTDDLLAIEPGDWGITGVSLRRPDQRDLLAPQDGLYTTLQRDGAGAHARIIGCLRDTLVAPEDPAGLVARMADPACRIVSLTITEKGYCHDPATGQLDAAHPDIRHDLENPTAPRSAVGLITAALAARRAAGQRPFTVLCCDNLPHNGRMLRGLVTDFAALRDDGLAGWIAANAAFPSTMVDRIVPAATAADVEAAATATGLYDAAAVSHEPFRQWVIEDRFVDGIRPTWERVGAQLVTDVLPYEHMKLRLLNGAHSALAYLGYLAGHETIADTVADPVFRTYVEALWREEVIPAVPPPPGVDMGNYAAQLLARFANPAVRHRTWQIAMDGSQKLPQRLLSTIRDRLAEGLPIPRLALAVAGWIRYVGGTDEAGRPIDVRDPLAASLRATLEGAAPEGRVEAILETEAVFGTDLPRQPAFVAAVGGAYARLLAQGARAAAAT
ncbi:mannitol dehydrogenase family protein [Roseomonas elaeocarpi]|uniref:Mannitol dehydrogenase family protein n=1 Tax=Roseomonas elaeocarpi TaxID=907779 RepID=A0ABV6JMH4_9PROT